VTASQLGRFRMAFCCRWINCFPPADTVSIPCRSAGDISTATRSEDGNDGDDGPAAGGGCSAMAAIKDSKEKNRQAWDIPTNVPIRHPNQ